MSDIILTLKACRINRNLRIVDVAKKVGRTDRTIKNWESGRSMPNGKDLQILASIYGVNIDQIFLGDEEALKDFYNQHRAK